MSVSVLHGDMLAILPTLDANSFDAVVTDPPYHLTSIVERFGSPTAAPAKAAKDGAFARASRGFMGKVWDGGDVAFRPETWAAVLRVLKPGGHMVCFGGTRRQHRMVCAIEDAGFEIKDTLCWLYGTGFPKSHDVSKAIDKAAGAAREVVGVVNRSGKEAGCLGAFAGPSPVTEPATPEAAQWQGWGSALKPAHEPIVLARKPLSEKSIAANFMRHGVGGINIDESRVPGIKPVMEIIGSHKGGSNPSASPSTGASSTGNTTTEGRFPANVLHDGSDEVMAAFAAFGEKTSGKPAGTRKAAFAWGSSENGTPVTGFGDSGTVARFFYSAKASAADRAGSKHPTVKPIALIEWLVRLVTPPGGKVLDPFAGSGTTGEACMKLGFDCTMIDLEADHVRDIQHRIKRWSGLDAPLFAEVP